MILTTRKTHAFIEIKVDGIETTIFKGKEEVEDMIHNLQDVIGDLLEYIEEPKINTKESK